MKALVDNDVLLKSSFYDLLEVLLTDFPKIGEPIGVLGAARFVLSAVIAKRCKVSEAEAVLARLLAFIDTNETLEPTTEERSLAAEFEAIAQFAGLALDTGESQLCAICLLRDVPAVLTGDKRAVIALEMLLVSNAKVSPLIGRVWCFEQVIKRSLTPNSAQAIWTSICSQKDIDKALSICFSCASGARDLDTAMAGLESYIHALRVEAPQILSV